MSDLISRQAAVDALDKRFDSIPLDKTEEILKLRRDLRALPSAQPQRIKGRWIDKNGNIVSPFWERYECSVCGARSENSNFCPNCGADMREEDDAAD
jgi:rubrerythrin